MKSKKFLSFFTAACVFVCPLAGEAVMPGISSDKYIRTYILGSEDIPVYTDKSLMIRGTAKPFREYDSAIYPIDEIRIYEITEDWAYVAYPTSWSGWREGYIPTNQITENNFSRDGLKFMGLWETVYKRANGARYTDSAIFDNDMVYTVARSGDYTQIVYPARNVYKMVWIDNDEYEKRIVNNPANKTKPTIPPERYRANLKVPYYAANDSRWTDKIGSGNSASLFTALAMKYSYHSESQTYPDYIMKQMQRDGEINLAVLKDFSYEYLNYHRPISDSILGRVLREIVYGKPVVIGIESTKGQKWGIIVGYDGMLTTPFDANKFFLNDPTNPECKTLADFMAEGGEVIRIIF